MKKIVILFFLSFFFFTGCKKEECGDGCYTWGGGYIKYNATLGFDFDSALDSLIIVKYSKRSYNNTPYYLEPELMRGVVYPYDEREFYMIKVMDSTTQYILASPVDVLDTKGDWYYLVWPED